MGAGLVLAASAPLALADGLLGTGPSHLGISPVSTSQSFEPVRLAVESPSSIVPTDVTHVENFKADALISPGLRFRLLQKLPSRWWFTSVTECTQRYETNAFQTEEHPKRDYVFRILPNVSLGYNFMDNTSIYCNYFVIKDLYAYHPTLSFPTTQSVSVGMRRDIDLPHGIGMGLDFQARELWQASQLRQSDLLPNISLNKLMTKNSLVFGSVLMQMRSGEFFQGPTRELDPFYTLGCAFRKGDWTFVAQDTLVNNFREPHFRNSIPEFGNNSMVADFELYRPVSKMLPNLVAFLRAEPIWNWNSHRQVGFSGFDFRLYTGLRLVISKPAYSDSIKQLRKQLQKIKQLKGPVEIPVPKEEVPASPQAIP